MLDLYQRGRIPTIVHAQYKCTVQYGVCNYCTTQISLLLQHEGVNSDNTQNDTKVISKSMLTPS